jgi:S-adenosylmethionine-diacylglycerol 3-amino-3-carboxypropyl transferase
MTAAPDPRSIQQRASFDLIRYGSVWEDADILCQALKPVAAGARLLSIASAGDNALALLTLDPKEVLAADLSAAQLACLELRIAAFQGLSYEALLGFLGVSPDAGRLDVYQGLRKRLSPEALAFWDGKLEVIALGAIHAGKLEGFLRRYQGFLRWVHGAERSRALLLPKGRAARAEFYHRTWNTWPWRTLNRLAFSRRILGRLGRDPEFFRHASEDVTSGPTRRLDQALAQRPSHANPYLRYHLTGSYASGALPRYLRREHFLAIRRRSSRVRRFLGPVEQAPGDFAGFNLSNIFEYMDEGQHALTYQKLADKALPGARLAYWNLHVERPRPPAERARVVELARLSKSLHARDQNWAYRSFHVDQRRTRNQ